MFVYPPAMAGHMVKRRVGVEYSPSMLEPVRPGAVSPERALCLPTFSHFLIVNKTSLSLGLLALSSVSQSRAMNEVDAGRDRRTPAWVRHDVDEPLYLSMLLYVSRYERERGRGRQSEREITKEQERFITSYP